MVKNITFAIDEETLDKVRVCAARRGTTVSAMVREYLTQIAGADDRIARARTEIRAMSGRDGLAIGDGGWTRDELYAR
jgi:plasmid stability protein